MSFVVRWLVGVIAVWLTVQLGRWMGVGLDWTGWLGAIVFVAVLAIVNALIRPIVAIFTLPLNCLTFGLFAFVVNALMFWLAASVAGGVEVKGFWAALFGSVVLTVLSGIMNSVIRWPSRR